MDMQFSCTSKKYHNTCYYDLLLILKYWTFSAFLSLIQMNTLIIMLFFFSQNNG